MRNFVQPGENLTIPAPEAVASGDVVIVGEIVGVAVHAAEAGDDVSITTEGVIALPSGDAFTLGAKVYWDAANALCKTTASGNTEIGVAVGATTGASGTVNVKIG